MTSLTSVEVASYARAVREALRDLSPEQSHTILDGLDEHLAEIVAEGASDLVAVLGPPAAYAAELRASAGLPNVGTEPAHADDHAEVSDQLLTDLSAPPASVAAPIADHDGGDGDADAPDDAAVLWSARLGGDRELIAARVVLVAVLGVLAVITIRASDPISAWQVVLGGIIVAAAWTGMRWLVRRAELPQPWASRAPIGLAGAAVVFALLLGGWLANSGTEYVYVDMAVPETTLGPFDSTGVVPLPDVIGLTYQDAVQVLAGAGLGVRLDGDPINLNIDTIVGDMSPAPGFNVAVGSVITLRMNGSLSPSTNVVTIPPQVDLSTAVLPDETTEPPTVQTTIAPTTSTSPPTTTLPPDTTLPGTTLAGG